MRISTLVVGAASLAAICAVTARASETVTYNYDALGRLALVVHTGSINNNVQAAYTHDKADNRTNVKITGSPNAAPSSMNGLDGGDTSASADDSAAETASDPAAADATDEALEQVAPGNE